ncbi:hypothetical protein Tco_0553909 [Tanacetum coccineum]
MQDNEWKNKSLSFAGRLQLCTSDISSMQVYWPSVLLIPKGIIYDIQQLIRGFLWCNGEYKRGKAKVAWADSSWGWRKLLQLRDTVRPFFVSTLGDGFNLACRVADFGVNGVWNWPQTWTLKVPDIAFIPAPNLDPNKHDVIHLEEFAPQLHESAGGLPSLKLSLHSCSLPGSTNAMGIETSIALVLPAREHECDTSFVLGRPPALS